MRHAATLNKHEVTIFKNIKETQTPFFKGVYYILERIKDGSSKDLVKQIRNESDKLKRNELKKKQNADRKKLDIAQRSNQSNSLH